VRKNLEAEPLGDLPQTQPAVLCNGAVGNLALITALPDRGTRGTRYRHRFQCSGHTRQCELLICIHRVDEEVTLGSGNRRIQVVTDPDMPLQRHRVSHPGRGKDAAKVLHACQDEMAVLPERLSVVREPRQTLAVV
jgi:hypothetical protein